jgi:hypothetical protein
MITETIAPLVKNAITKNENKDTNAASGCCGGTPTNDAAACCKLEEEKKAEGEEGCGCNTSSNASQKSSCC